MTRESRMAETERKALRTLSNMIRAGAGLRYCGMCDEWVKGRECPKCGADTDAPERGMGCPECDSGNTPHTLAHEGKP